MIVCLCEGVNERSIRSCIDEGSRTVKAVARACDAGTGCGQCHPDIKRLIAERRGAATGVNSIRTGIFAALCNG